VRSHLPEVGVLILTAYDDEPYIMAVLQAGANGYVLKTAKTEELIQAVRDVYEGKSALDSIITQKLMSNLFKRSEKTPVVEPLTDRELDVLRLAAKGFTNKSIGVQLSISDRTVQGHLAHIFAKLQAASRTEAVMRGVGATGSHKTPAPSPKNEKAARSFSARPHRATTCHHSSAAHITFIVNRVWKRLASPTGYAHPRR